MPCQSTIHKTKTNLVPVLFSATVKLKNAPKILKSEIPLSGTIHGFLQLFCQIENLRWNFSKKTKGLEKGTCAFFFFSHFLFLKRTTKVSFFFFLFFFLFVVFPFCCCFFFFFQEKEIMSAFEEIGVMPELIKAVEEDGWQLPTDIQVFSSFLFFFFLFFSFLKNKTRA